MEELRATEIAIQDTCILLDLVDLELLDLFFTLNLEVYTTSSVVDEIITEEHKSKVDVYLENEQLIIDDEGLFETITELSNQFTGLSFADCSVLELAKRKDAILLSADGKLRKVSRKEGMTVRGTLWIVKVLYNEYAITLDEVKEKLNLYISVNPRAPKKEIQKMLERLGVEE